MSVSWDSCNLNNHIINVVKIMGFKQMMPVQAATIPVFMKNKDVCVEAVTGSGKTLSFIIPVLETLMKKSKNIKKHQVGSIIISPTRELASQIFEVLKVFLHPEKCPFTSCLIIGGRGEIEKDLKMIQSTGSNIIVGTPGRISALFEECSLLKLSLPTLEVLVLDEADRLLDLGFHKSLVSILSFLPKQRRTGLFSATQTHEVDQLIKAGLRNPVKITVSEKKDIFAAAYQTGTIKTPSTLSNQYIVCSTLSKFNTLVDIVMAKKSEKILIFFATCASVDYFGRALKEFLGKDVNMMLLHGKLRKKRLSVFTQFRQMDKGILACTDVMARGIDIPDVNWVFQFDPPSNATAFVHRCGRTARVGKTGNALLFLLESETAYVDFIEINQKAPMIVYQHGEDRGESTDWLDKLRHLAMNDRAVMERGTRAFVSFIQSYCKHECSLIFRLKDLNFGELATGFALLKLPKMPELRNKKIVGFTETDIDITAIPYKNPEREKHRQESLQKPEESYKKPKFVPKKFKSWTEARKKRELKRERKKMRVNKKPKDENQEESDPGECDSDELDKDFKMITALKKRKMSFKQYGAAIAEEERQMFGAEPLT